MESFINQFSEQTSTAGQLWFTFTHGGWVLVVILLVFILYELYIEEIQHQFMAVQEWVFLSIRIPKTNQLSTLAVEQIFIQMHGIAGSPSFAEKYVEGKTQLSYSLEIVSLGGKTSFIIRAPKKFRELVESAFYAQYPGAEIIEVEDFLHNVHFNGESDEFDIWGTEFKLTENFALPIRTYREFEHTAAENKILDPLKPVFEAMNSMKPHEVYAIQILVLPVADSSWKPEGEEKAKELIEGKEEHHGSSFFGTFLDILSSVWSGVFAFFTPAGEEGEEKKEESKAERDFSKLSDVEKDRVNLVLTKVSKPGFKTKIRHLYMAPRDKFDATRKALMVGAYRTFGSANTNSFKADSVFTGTSYDYKVSESLEKPYIDRILKKRKLQLFKGFKSRSYHIGLPAFVLNVEEIATIYHLPLITEESTVKSPIESVESKKSQPPPNLPVGEY